MSDTPQSPGVEILSLGITDEPVVQGLANIDAAIVKNVKHIDDLTAATVENQKWVTESQKKYQALVQALEAEQNAVLKAAQVERDMAAAREMNVKAGVGLIAKLEDLVKVYGLTTEELYRLAAAELNVVNAAEPLIAKLEQLKTATAQYGKVITDVSSIEAARIEFETTAQTVFNAFKRRTLAENAALEEAAATSLNAQRRRSIAENQAAEESAAISLAAFKRRTLAENRALAIAEIEEMDKLRKEDIARQESAATVLAAFKARTLNENRAEAMRILTEQEQAAVKLAEKQAIEEIKWTQTSVRTRIAELERLRAYQLNPAISATTISDTFSSAALKDLPNLTRYQNELNAAQTVGHRTTKNLTDAHGELSGVLGNTRVKTEGLVLAHELYMGQTRRLTGSLMVMAEYITATGASFIGMTGLVIGAVGALTLLGFGMVKGILEQKQMSDALIMTGNYAGQTAESLNSLAHTAAGASGSIGEAKKVVTELAASGRFTGDQIAFVTAAVVGLEHATGRSVENTIHEFETLATESGKSHSKMADHISNNLLKLNDHYHFLTVAVYEQIRAMEREGDQAGASSLATAVFAEAVDKRTKEAVENLGHVESAWKNIKHAIGQATDAVNNWGKTQGPAARVTNLTAQQSGLEDNLKYSIPGGAQETTLKMKLALVNKDLTAATLELNRVMERAAEQASVAKVQEDGLYASREIGTLKARLLKKDTEGLTEALAKYHQEVALAVKANPKSAETGGANSPEEVQKIERLLKESFTKKTAAIKDARTIDLAILNEAAKQEYKLAEDAINADIRLANDAHSKKLLSDTAYYERVRSDLAKQTVALEKEHKAQMDALTTYSPKSNDGGQDAARVQKAVQAVQASYTLAKQKISEAGSLIDQKEQEATIKNFDAIRKATERTGSAELKQLNDTISKQREHNLEIGKTKAQIDLLRKAELDRLAATEQAEATAIQDLLQEFAITGPLTIEQQKVVDIYSQQLFFLNEKIKARAQLASLKEEAAPADAAVQLLEDQRKAALQASGYWKDVGQEISDALSKGFGDGITAMGNMLVAYAKFAEQQATIDKRLAESKKLAHGDPKETAKAEQQAATDSARIQVRAYADMASAAQSFFKEGTTGYNLLGKVSQAYHLYEMMLALESFIKKQFFRATETTEEVAMASFKAEAVAAGMLMDDTATANSVVNNGIQASTGVMAGAGKMFGQSGWGGFIGVAAMLAVMAALGFAGGGGGSGASMPSSEDRQKTQGTGSVLGDETAKSKSLSNAIDLLEKNSSLLLPLTNSMLSALLTIRDNIKGMAAAISQTTGLRGGPQDTVGLGLGTDPGILGMFKSSTTLTDQGIEFGKAVWATVETHVRGVDGENGSTEGYTITSQVLKLVGQTIAEIRKDGVQGRKYSETLTENSGFFGIGSSSESKRIFDELDENIKKQMTRTVLSIADGVQAAGLALGMAGPELSKKIDEFNVELGMVSLKGLKGQELQDELNAVFSRFADALATDVIPGLEQFQQVGEGYFETVIRVATGVEKAKLSLEQLGITSIKYSEILNKQGDVALEIIRQSVVMHEASIGAGQGISNIMQGFNGTADDAIALYIQLTDVRKEMRSFGGTLADVTLEMVKGAGSLDKLASGLKTFHESFYSTTEQTAAAGNSLRESMQGLGIEMPRTREEYRNMTEIAYHGATVANQNSAAYQRLYGGMLANAEAADKYYSALEKLQGSFETNMQGLGARNQNGSAAQFAAANVELEKAGVKLTSTSQLLSMTTDDFSHYSIAGQAAIENYTALLVSTMDKVGLSIGSFSSILEQGLLGEISGADVGKKLGDMVIKGVYKALADNVANTISGIIMNTLITPLMTSVLQEGATAASIAGAMSETAVAAMIASANRAVEALMTLFNDPAFKALMERLKTMFNGLNFSGNGYVAPPTTGGGGSEGTSGDGGKAYRDAIKSLTDDIRKFGEALANIGETSYEAAVRQIREAARAKAEQLAGMDNTDAIASLQTEAKTKAQKEFDDWVKSAAEAQAALHPGEMVNVNALAGYSEAYEKYKKAMEAAGTLTIDNTALLEAWVKVQIDLLNAQNKLKAKVTTDDMAKQIKQLGMTDFEKELADINDRAIAYTKSLQDLGQLTAENIAKVKEWQEAMLAAANMHHIIDAMKELAQQMDKVAELANGVAAAQQSIRQDGEGYDLAGYLAGQVSQAKEKLAALTNGSIEDRIKAANDYQNAIVAQYENEKSMLNNKLDLEKQAYEKSIAATNKEIDATNKISETYTAIGEYQKTLLVGNLSPLNMVMMLAQASKDYHDAINGADAGDQKSADKVQENTSKYLENLQLTSKTSVDYAREFNRVQNDLSRLSAKSLPKIEEVTADGFKISASLQKEMNESQERAIAELQKIKDLTDSWQKELQDKMKIQAQQLVNLNVTNAMIAANTAGLDVRIAAAIAAAMTAHDAMDTVTKLIGGGKEASDFLTPPTMQDRPAPVQPNVVTPSIVAKPNNNDVVVELRTLQSKFDKMSKTMDNVASSTKTTADIFDGNTGGGGLLQVEVV